MVLHQPSLLLSLLYRHQTQTNPRRLNSLWYTEYCLKIGRHETITRSSWLDPFIRTARLLSSLLLCNHRQDMGHAVAYLVEALSYKSEGRGFDSRWRHWNFSLTKSVRPPYGPGVDSASNTNEYREYFLGGKGGRYVRLTTLPPSRAECLEILEPQPTGTLSACPGL